MIRYFYKRKGLLFMLALGLCRAGIFDREKVYGSLFLTKRFYHYFECLPTTEYYDELHEQLAFIYNGLGKKYNVLSPETYNEKIQWTKIYGLSPLVTSLVDKYKVREWVAERVGYEHIIPIVGGPWAKGEEIDFDKLPDCYVLKANHGSGMNIVIKDGKSIDRKQIVKRVNLWIDTLFGWKGMESQYFSVPRRIFAEKYIEQPDGGLYDYKIFCFDGVAKYIRVQGDRNLEKHLGKQAFFDVNWNLLSFSPGDYPDFEYEIPKPGKLDELIKIAETLSCGFRHVRVDLYLIDDMVYFGEMTFTPCNGMFPWKPMQADKMMGDNIKL